MNFYGATIATKRHASQSQGTQNENVILFILKYTTNNMILTLYMSFLLSGIEFNQKLKIAQEWPHSFYLIQKQKNYSTYQPKTF